MVIVETSMISEIHIAMHLVYLIFVLLLYGLPLKTISKQKVVTNSLIAAPVISYRSCKS